MAELNLVQAINQALAQEMARDKDVIVFGEDVGMNGGVFRVTEGLQKKFPKRVFDSPLAEGAIVGTAVGLAVYGMKPVCEIQFSGFLPGGFDQLISHASRVRTRTRGRYTCPLVVRTPYSGGIHAPEHHSESMESCYIHVPGLKVVIPSTPSDAKGLLISAIRDPDPVLFLEPKRIYRAVKEDVATEEFTIPLGEAKVAREGTDVTLISWGAMMVPTLQAAEKSCYSCEVIDLRTVSPLDVKAILASVEKTGRAVIVHEAPKTLGLGAEVSALLSEKAILHLKAPLERVTGWDVPYPLFKLEEYYLPSVARIEKAIVRLMGF